MIQDRLAETLDRVAAAGPDEAGAFDRFLRHRARRTRRVAGATALVLVAVLASAVALPRLVRDPRPPRLYVSGVPGPERWQRGPLVAVAPVQGFEVDVPAGWEASPTWKGLALRPVSQDLRRRLAVPVALDTSYLEEFYHPDRDQVSNQDGSWLPHAVTSRIRQDPQSRGRFPEGRGWFRTDGRDGPWHLTRWYVSWPYHCQSGQDCPDALATRALRVAFQVEEGAAPEATALAERLLSSARPITNAVEGQAHGPRPDCLEARSAVAKRWAAGRLPGISTPLVVQFLWDFRTTANLVPCTVRGPLGVELLDSSGRRLEVRGNGLTVAPVGDLPESRGSAREAGLLKLRLKWINWCGEGPARLRWLGEPASDRLRTISTPRCTDDSKPSVLSVERDPWVVSSQPDP